MAVTSMSQSSIGSFDRRNTFVNPIVTYGWQERAVIGGYEYLIFTESSALVIANGNPECDIIVVGGGGAGGRNAAGGGGAGAVEGAGPGYWATQTLPVGSYTVTIGAGGDKALANAYYPGGDSVFEGTSTITAKGGGGGGYNNSQAGQAGGSGGGGCGGDTGGSPPGNPGGSASGSNTNAGGAGVYQSPWLSGGGGGGATAAGTNSGFNSPGAGGQGLALTTLDSNLTSANFSSFSGMTHIASGGGGSNSRTDGGSIASGGLGGTGGGQGGAVSTTVAQNLPTAATSYGSGGGGGAWAGTQSAPYWDGMPGYQGLVIVRFAV